MKKIFTLIAATLMAVGVQAQQTIDLTGLQETDFTFTNGEYACTAGEGIVSFDYVKGGSVYCKLQVKGLTFNYKNSGQKTGFFVASADYFTVAGKGVQLTIPNVTKGHKITLNVAKKDTPDDSNKRMPGFTATGAQIESDAMTEAMDKEVFVDVVFAASNDGDVVISNGSNAYLIKSIKIEDGTFVLKDGDYFIQHPGGDAVNSFTDGAGFKLQITSDTEKTYSKGSQATIGGIKYYTIKCSNGAENTLTLPEGKVTSAITLYSTLNADALVSDKPAFWQEVAGTAFKNELEGEELTSCKNYANMDVRTYNFKNGKLNKITFKNKNVQCFFLVKVTIETGTETQPDAVELDLTTGIATVKAVKANDAMFNVAGQKVAEGYKGLVIMNGKKYVK